MKRRIVGYIFLMFISIIFVLIYIDGSLFSNVRKTIYSYRYNVSLRPYDYIKNEIQPDNLMGGELIIIDSIPYLSVKGFESVRLHSQDKSILKRKELHPTQQLVLFSFPYLSEYLLNKTKYGKLSSFDSKIVNDVYSLVSSEITNPLSVNSMTVNDHVVSDRIQFLLLYTSYINKYESGNKDLINKLKKDLSMCLSFLLNDEFFTWQSNHGIMQIRALAQIASATTDEKVVLLCKNKIENRLSDILPFFVGDDGAIYESAPGYWLLIYDQFRKISEIKICQTLPAIKELKNKVTQMKQFIQIVSANDGYLQGMGDSYSSFNGFNDQMRTNRNFSFSNKLVGYNWTSDSVNSGLLFVSLSTAPEVHKHPEDLALYVYSNGSFFGNTGIFSYRESSVRAYFRTELSQNTVSLSEVNNCYPVGSDIIKLKDNLYLGKKWYNNGDTVFRELSFINSVRFQIKDYSNSKQKIRSRFIIDYRNKIEFAGTQILKVTNTSGKNLHIQSSVPLKLKKTIQSDNYNNIVKTNAIELLADTLVVKFFLDGSSNKPLDTDQFLKIPNEYQCKRYETALLLNKKYCSHSQEYQNIKGVVVKSFSYVFFLLMIIIAIIEVIVLFYGKSKRQEC